MNLWIEHAKIETRPRVTVNEALRLITGPVGSTQFYSFERSVEGMPTLC